MNIKNYHFHLYYSLDAEAIALATEVLGKLAEEKAGVPIGRIWEKPVGPHPIGSCQVTVETENFYEMMVWFLENRRGLSLFIHPDTGNALIDHTEHVIWIGREHPLNTSSFSK